MKCRLLLLVSFGTALTLAADDKVDFQKTILPVIRDTCLQCHGPEKQKGGLRLDTKSAALKGGKGGVSIKPGDGAGSEFYRRVILPKTDDDFMPKDGEPLPKACTDLIKAWIDQGANWPDDLTIAAAPKPVAPAAAATAAPAAVAKRAVQPAPEPELPKDFKPGGAEPAALAALAKAGIDARPLAQNTPWRAANLRLLGTNVTDATLASLKDVTSLIELDLATTKVTDAGLTVLTNLPYLTKLHLELTGVTDAGLAHVAALPNLAYLNLYGTTITDAGLEQLKGLKYLRSLFLWQSKVTPAAAEKFREARPTVDVNLGWEPAPTNAPAAAPAKEAAK